MTYDILIGIPNGKVLVLIILISFLLNSPNTKAQDTWNIAVLNWEPYSGKNIDSQGDSIKRLRTLLNKKNIELVVHFYPWNRAKLLGQEGVDYIGVFPAWPEDTFKGAILSPAIDWSEISVLKRSTSDIRFTSIEDLFSKYKVGIVSTYIYPKLIDDLIVKYQSNVEKAPDEVALLKKLDYGRSDVAITDPRVMKFLADKKGVDEIEIVTQIMDKELVLALKDNEANRKRLELLKELLRTELQHSLPKTTIDVN